ncbi:hypothetical protein H4R24_004451 [Coemansia sp. RSA 988]|nr:hypothetical protein H4R24_004451 [Coemansia sp. RSA 988]
MDCDYSIAKYSNSSEKRKWNRDTAAVLNFQHILQGLRENQCVPEHFQHPKCKKPADTEPTFNESTAGKQPPKHPLSQDSDSESDQPLIKLLRGATIDETTTLPQMSDLAIADAVLMGAVLHGVNMRKQDALEALQGVHPSSRRHTLWSIAHFL